MKTSIRAKRLRPLLCGKRVAFRQATEPEELSLASERAEPFHTAGGAAAGEGSFHTDSEAPPFRSAPHFSRSL